MSLTKRFLRRPQVLTKTGFSKTTLYNLEKAKSFPQHIMLTPRTAVWDEALVDAWMTQRAQAPATPVDVSALARAKEKALETRRRRAEAL